MAYEPKTEAGKQAIVDGADPKVIEDQEAAGELIDEGEPTHVDKPGEGEPQPKVEEPKAGEEPGEPGAGDKGDNPPPDRTPQYMPVWKHKEELKHAREEMERNQSSAIEQAVTAAIAKQGGATTEDVAKIAEDFGMTAEAATAFMERMTTTIEKRLGIDDLKKDVEARKQIDLKAAEERGFRDEFASSATQDVLRTAANGQAITAEVEAKLKELAYTTTYSRYRLADIIKLEGSSLFPAAPAESRTAERGRGGASRAAPTPKTLDDITPENIDNMTDEEFQRFSDGLATGQSRFARTTLPKGKS